MGPQVQTLKEEYKCRQPPLHTHNIHRARVSCVLEKQPFALWLCFSCMLSIARSTPLPFHCLPLISLRFALLLTATGKDTLRPHTS